MEQTAAVGATRPQGRVLLALFSADSRHRYFFADHVTSGDLRYWRSQLDTVLADGKLQNLIFFSIYIFRGWLYFINW